jgi:hypothetical protein
MALNLNLASGYHLPEISSALKSYVAATGKPDTLNLTPSDTSAPPDTGPPPPDNAPPPGAPLINALPEAAQPIPIAPVDPNAAPTPGAVPTESSGDRAARAAKESFYDFENNPVGSLGRAMAQFAAGYRGDPNGGPLAQFDKQKLEEQALGYKKLEFGMNFLDKALPLIEAAPADQKAAVAQHLQESIGGQVGHDFMPLFTAVINGDIKNGAEKIKAIQSYVTDPKLAALIAADPKLIDVFAKAVFEAKGKAAGEPDKTYNVPSGGVVIGAKGNIIFDNRKGDTEKTYTLGPGEIVKNAKNETIATGPAAKETTPKIGAPTHLQIEDPNGEVRDVTAQQLENGSWVTADGKRTPIDVGDKFRVLTGTASSTASSMNARFMNRVTESVNLGMKELDNIAHLSAGATTGTFAEAGLAGTPVGMLARQVTPQEDQFMSSAGVGLGRALAGIEAMGLMPQGSLTNNFEKLLPKAGQSRLTAMANLGHMRQTIESGIETALDTKQLTKEQTDRLQQYQKQVKEIIPWLPQDVYKLSQSKNPKATLRDFGVGQIEKGKAAAKSSVMDQADAILKGGP